MSKWKKIELLVLAIIILLCVYALIMTLIDPAWYFGKTYGASTEETETEAEISTTEEERRTSEQATQKEKARKPYYHTRIPESIEETRTTVPAALETETEARPVETQTAAPTTTIVETQRGPAMIAHYSIDGKMMDPTLQDILYTELKEQGMDWFMPYAVAQARAESGADFSPYAVSKDGKDKGLFQYREKYWKAKASRIGQGDADIFNPVVQIYVYVFEMSSRWRSGISDPAQLISAHKTAGYGYDGAYVEYVMQFVSRLKQEKGR